MLQKFADMYLHLLSIMQHLLWVYLRGIILCTHIYAFTLLCFLKMSNFWKWRFITACMWALGIKSVFSENVSCHLSPNILFMFSQKWCLRLRKGKERHECYGPSSNAWIGYMRWRRFIACAKKNKLWISQSHHHFVLKLSKVHVNTLTYVWRPHCLMLHN